MVELETEVSHLCSQLEEEKRRQQSLSETLAATRHAMELYQKTAQQDVSLLYLHTLLPSLSPSSYLPPSSCLYCVHHFSSFLPLQLTHRDQELAHLRSELSSLEYQKQQLEGEVEVSQQEVERLEAAQSMAQEEVATLQGQVCAG